MSSVVAEFDEPHQLDPSVGPRQARVLLVEDDADAARLATMQMKQSPLAEFFVTRVASLAEALRCIESARFDVVVLDLGLPDSETLPTVGIASLLTAHLPVLVYSGARDAAVVTQAMESGVCDFLSKSTPGAHVLPGSIIDAIERTFPSGPVPGTRRMR
jgi:DNA-binding NtrC family response regulator